LIEKQIHHRSSLSNIHPVYSFFKEEMPKAPAAQQDGIDLGDLTEKNVAQLKLLNTNIFPVHYNEQFYAALFKQPEEYVKLGLLSSIESFIDE